MHVDFHILGAHLLGLAHWLVGDGNMEHVSVRIHR